MEKRTGNRLDCGHCYPAHFSIHRLDLPISFPLMAGKEDSFINLHSTFSHDAKSSPSLYSARR
jgi:hypothetical protein